MKNIILKTLSLSFIMALILSSCSKDNSVVSNSRIQKRKYTSGFHLDFNKKHKTSKGSDKIDRIEMAEVESVKEEKTIVFSQQSTGNVYAEEQTRSNDVSTDEMSFDDNLADDKAEESLVTTKSDESVSLVSETVHSDKQSAEKTKVNRKDLRKIKKESKEDSMRIESIIYIILCIFIPFVAVGLATDWDVTKTVIALLLTFLFWIPGMIYAFYVCDQQGVI